MAGRTIVIVAGRDLSAAAQHRSELGDRNVVLTCDVSTVDGCARLVDDVAGHTDHVDVLINNAGVMTPDRHVSPDGHELNFADLESERGYDPFLAYSRSKLANLLFTYELVRRHGGELLVSALHPGQVRTSIGRHFPSWRVAAAQLTAISPARAAPAITSLALEPLTTNGGYYDRSDLVRSSPPSYDADVARRLWEISESMCGPFGAPIATRASG
jgi:NAD(P)-dependent dehydrogenase (short-subunit alcohol dehydrogenase family)